MSDDRCRFVASDQPRMLVDRHIEGCEANACRGCQPCTHTHCVVCGIQHSVGACASCVGAVREDIELVEDMYARLPEEALNSHADGRVGQGPLGGEAMNMLGPWSAAPLASVLDAETWRASEVHPLHLLAGWEDIWRDWQDDPTTRLATVEGSAGYLRENLYAMANAGLMEYDDGTLAFPPDFPQFATEVRQMRGRLEDLLRDGERQQTGAPCLRCSANLVRDCDPKTGGLLDSWTCPSCSRWYTDLQYANAVAAGYASLQAESIDGSTWATVQRAAQDVGRSARTIKTWAAEGIVRRACLIIGRRDVVSVDDAKREHDTRKRRMGRSA